MDKHIDSLNFEVITSLGKKGAGNEKAQPAPKFATDITINVSLLRVGISENFSFPDFSGGVSGNPSKAIVLETVFTLLGSDPERDDAEAVDNGSVVWAVTGAGVGVVKVGGAVGSATARDREPPLGWSLPFQVPRRALKLARSWCKSLSPVPRACCLAPTGTPGLLSCWAGLG